MDLVSTSYHTLSALGERTIEGNLEGATSVDAIIVNVDNGFALLIEAKVLSDVSTTVSFDAFRNQIARNMDVTSEDGQGPTWPGAGKAKHPPFALLTSKCFQTNDTAAIWVSYEEYKRVPTTLARDLPHRDENWPSLKRRSGWVTFEDINECDPAHVRG